MVPTYVPTSAHALSRMIADRVRGISGRGVVAVDGADAARPTAFAQRIAEEIRADGRPADVVALHDFVRPASVRLEYGHTDELSYRSAWFDFAALQREVVDGLRLHGRWLPRLWDERNDRSARAGLRNAGPTDIVIIAGPMLLGRGFVFDLSVRLDLSEAALRRKTTAEELWTVPALLEHDAQALAEPPDFVVRWDHPDRPALRA
jgi:hypothetical protein